MHDLAAHTHTVRKTGRLTLKALLRVLPAFQRACGKTRKLDRYILRWVDKAARRFCMPMRFCLVVNEINGGGTLNCAHCGHRMCGNGRSIKYVVQIEQLAPRRQAAVVYIILCPQECCPCCRMAGRHYCHKIIPQDTAYCLSLFSAIYEAAMTGDADGTCPLSDSTIIRHCRRFLALVGKCFTRPPDKVAAVLREAAGSRGFNAITRAVGALLRAIGDRMPAVGWYSRLCNAAHLKGVRG